MLKRDVQGLSVIVESPKDSIRQWYDRDAKTSGQTKMLNDYGYLEGHVGADGDEVDCYVGDDESSKFVYVVHQLKTPDYKAFDEDKAFLSFRSETDAKNSYLAHRSDGEKAYGGMSAIPLEAFKAKLKRRTGSGKIRHEGQEMIIFDAQRDETGKVRTGVWDRICVPGVDEKEGMSTEFSSETLSQFINNFLERADPIPMDWNHQSNYAKLNGQPAPALAWYGALALVWNGKLEKFGALKDVEVSHDGLDLSRDGLWALRTEVTEIGQQLLPGFKFVSPTFTPEGTRRDGTPCGYMLSAIAATNSPWQSQTQITFDSSTDAKSVTNKKEEATMAKLAGVAKLIGMEGNPDDAAVKEALHAKMEEAAMGAASDEKFDYAKHAGMLEEAAKAYEDSQMDEEDGDEPPHQAMRKMSAKFRKLAKMSESEGEGEKEEEKKEMAKSDEADTKFAVMEASLRATQTKLEKLEKAESERAEVTKRERERLFESLADQAIAGGYPKESKNALLKFARIDFDGARASVAHLLPKTGAPAHLFERVTENGAPVGRGKLSREEAISPKPRKVQAMGMTFIEDDADFAAEIRKLAESKDPVLMERLDKYIPAPNRGEMFYRLLAAEKIVRAERPELVTE